MAKKKIKKRYIVLAVVLVLLLVLGGLAFWQRENIQALLDFTSYSKEEIEDQLQQNDQAIKDTVSAIPEITIRDVTEEEREALKDGTLTQEELMDLILGRGDSDTQSQPPQEEQPSQAPEETPSQAPAESEQPKESQPVESEPDPTPTPSQTPLQSDYEKRLSELVAMVYVLREEYLIELDALLDEAKELYKSTPKEKRTTSWLTNTVSDYLAKGTALERQCDQRMDAIVIEMEALIKENNGDTSLVDTVIETYANEKRLKKAWYMSKLEEKGLV